MPPRRALRAPHATRGAALLFAMVAAVVVALTAGVVLNLTLRRFELSALRSDRAGAVLSSEAGVQYAFARLTADAAFRNRVINAPSPPYTISPAAPVTPNSEPDPRLRFRYYVGITGMQEVDEDVTVRIRFRGAGVSPPFEVRASVDY